MNLAAFVVFKIDPAWATSEPGRESCEKFFSSVSSLGEQNRFNRAPWPLTLHAHPEEARPAEFSQFFENPFGFFAITPSGSTIWAPDGGPIERKGYITGDASHLAVLKRAIGNARFSQVMQSLHPEAAAMAALEELRLASDEPLADPGMQAEVDRVAHEVKAIPPTKPLPPELMFAVLNAFKRLGIYGDSVQQRYGEFLMRYDWPEPVIEFKTQTVMIIAGNVELWRRAKNPEIRQQQTLFVRLTEPWSKKTRIRFHMQFVELAQEILGPDRVIYNPEGMSRYHAWNDSGSRLRREVEYEPEELVLSRGGRYEINELNGTQVEAGSWRER